MRRIVAYLTLAVAVLALAVLVLNPSEASAAPRAPVTATGGGKFAHASFSSETDGVQTFAFIDATDFFESGPFGEHEDSRVFVGIDKVGPGDAFQSFSGSTSVAPEQFQVSGDLASATLNAVVNVCGTGGCFDVTVNLTWTGSGETQTFNGKTIVRAGGNCRIHSTFTDSHRHGSATGTISDGATNFTPNPSDFAEVGTFDFRDRFTGDCAHLFPPPPGP